MRKKRSRFALLGILALALTVTAGLTLSDGATAKKKKGGGGGTKTISHAGGPIPNATQPPDTTGDGFADYTGNGGEYHRGLLVSKITVGRKFAGAKIKDLNVQVSATHADISDLLIQLVGPNGNLVTLDNNNGNVLSPPGPPPPPATVLGPTTFDDQATLFISDTNSCPNDPEFGGASCPASFPTGGGVEARPPYAGNFKPDDGTLASLGSKLMGNWVLLVFDTDPDVGNGPGMVAQIGNLTNWKLIAQLKGGGK